MAKVKVVPPKDNFIQEFLIDEIYRMRSEQKALKALEGNYTERLKARLTDANGNPTPLTEANKAEMAEKEFSSDEVTMTIKYVSQDRLDGDLLRKLYPKVAAECTKSIEFNQLQFKPKTTPEAKTKE